MHKSKGNGISPETIVQKYGADVLRLWVASSDYHSDVKISDNALSQISESYRKIRNTCRFILANIADFDPDKDMVKAEELMPIDRWALARLNALIAACKKAYDGYEFYQAFHAIIKFCVVDMSNFYLDVLKDRLYCDGKESVSRRAAQSVIFEILDSMIRLVSPILAYTSDEVWQFMPHRKGDNKDNIVFNSMPEAKAVDADEAFMAEWDKLHAIRDEVQKALEGARKEKVIGKSLEAVVTLFCDADMLAFLRKYERTLNAIFIVSGVILDENDGSVQDSELAGLAVKVEKAAGKKCERCWAYDETVGHDSEHPTLCERCRNAIK